MECYPGWMQWIMAVPWVIFGTAFVGIIAIALPYATWQAIKDREWWLAAVFICTDWLVLSAILIVLCEEGLI